MNNVMKMTVPGKPEFLNLCSDAAVTFAAVSGMDVDAVEDFAMAVYEACKILTCHESDCWCSRYDLQFEAEDGRIVVTVTTCGEYNIEKCRRICYDCPNEGNLGLQIMRSIMDEVEIDRDYDDGSGSGKKIIMVKNIC